MIFFKRSCRCIKSWLKRFPRLLLSPTFDRKKIAKNKPLQITLFAFFDQGCLIKIVFEPEIRIERAGNVYKSCFQSNLRELRLIPGTAKGRCIFRRKKINCQKTNVSNFKQCNLSINSKLAYCILPHFLLRICRFNFFNSHSFGKLITKPPFIKILRILQTQLFIFHLS